MSHHEIRSAETDESSRLVNEDGERLIQMLSVIASNVDKAYPGSTEDATNGTTVVTVPVQDQHGFTQMYNLPISTGNGQAQNEILPTIVHIDNQNIAMVQHEVVVGMPELTTLPDDTTITIQSLQPHTAMLMDETNVMQKLSSTEIPIESAYTKKMTFMTNYRDYTIVDFAGRICIGERKHVLMVQPTCKMVPVTDVSTGHKFEYQYRARGTIKRYEGKRQVVYFIGQISNERILALFYQTVFQLVCKVGKIDLDKDYTSGKRVLSTYFSSFGPSTSRTIRTPIEKLTYMKLLIVGDVDVDEEDEDNVILLDDDDGTPAKPSKKLKKSNAYKKPHVKKALQKAQIKIVTADIDNSVEYIAAQEGITLRDDDTYQILPTPPVRKTPTGRGRGRPPKKRPIPGVVMPPKSGTPVKKKATSAIKKKPHNDETEGNSAVPLLSDRGSSKRKVKRPSKLSDYYDFTKRVKKEPGIEDEDSFSDKEMEESVDESSEKWDQSLKMPALDLLYDKSMAKSTMTVNEAGDSLMVGSVSDKVSIVITEQQLEAMCSSQSGMEATPVPVQDIAQSSTLELIEKQNFDENIQASGQTEQSSAANNQSISKQTAISTPQKTVGRIASKIIEKKKRGPGRPRKYPPKDASEFDEAADIDELVMQRKKYPSCQFQRASTLKRYLCQACLTKHVNPIEEGGKTDACPIVNPRQTFHDQTAMENGSGACSLMSLPTCLSVKVAPETRKLTVCAGQDIPMYTEFGPLVGILLSEDDIQIDTDLSHVWFLQHEEGSEKFYLYTGDANASNWCHYLTPVAPSSPYNTVMVLREEGIYFTTSQKITAGTEIKLYVPYFGCKTRPVAVMNQQECLHCKWSFQTTLDYQKHYHIFHPGGFTKQKQKCRLCNRSFPGMKDLQKHMEEKHEGQGAFQCDECTGTFPNPARLRIHKRDVHPPPEAAVKCDKCGKVYRTKRALANHNTNVHSEFKFACEICGKWFDRRSTLLRHQRLHSGKSAHFCVRCGKGFRDLHNLKVHTLTHSGVRPFPCQCCENCSFSTRTCLKRHYETFHKLSDDLMPDLNRTVPFTMEAYSGMLPPVEKPVPRNTIFKLVKMPPGGQQTANRNSRSVIRLPQLQAQPGTEQIIELVEGVDTDGQMYLHSREVEGHEDEEDEEEEDDDDDTTLPSVGDRSQPELQGILQGESLFQPDMTDSQEKDVQLQIGEDDQSLQIEQVVRSQDLGLVEMSGLVAGNELVEADQMEGDHCYYALNVDGQQVLVPATEEVCVIVENDNIITLPAHNT